VPSGSGGMRVEMKVEERCKVLAKVLAEHIASKKKFDCYVIVNFVFVECAL